MNRPGCSGRAITGAAFTAADFAKEWPFKRGLLLRYKHPARNRATANATVRARLAQRDDDLVGPRDTQVAAHQFIDDVGIGMARVEQRDAIGEHLFVLLD